MVAVGRLRMQKERKKGQDGASQTVWGRGQSPGEDVTFPTVTAGNGVHGIDGRQLSKLLPHDFFLSKKWETRLFTGSKKTFDKILDLRKV